MGSLLTATIVLFRVVVSLTSMTFARPDLILSSNWENPLSLDAIASKVERYSSLFAVAFPFSDYSLAKSISFSPFCSFISKSMAML